jgi:putative spermidine/putrescine transport system ATP-binding protein
MFSDVVIPLSNSRKIETGQALDIAVRRDDVELLAVGEPAGLPPDSTSVPGTILGIEYQGNFVKVMMDAAGEEEFVAYVPERRFFEDSMKVGDRVMAVWPIERTQLLA